MLCFANRREVNLKVATLTSVYGEHAVGGAERSTARMVASLIDLGHTVDVISLGAPGSNVRRVQHSPLGSTVDIPLTQFYDPYGLAATEVQPTRSFIQRAAWHTLDIYNPWMTGQVTQQLARLKPDVLFTHALQGFSVGVWAAAKQLGIKVVHMIHDHALICPGTAMTRGSDVCDQPCRDCQVFSIARRAIAASPDAIVAPSQMVIDRHRKFGWFKEVSNQVVVANALPQDWPVKPKPKVWPGPSNPRPWVFGFLGRMDASKGTDTLVRAASGFTPKQCRVKLAGKGNMHELLLDFQGNPDVLEFCGVVQAASFLSEIDVLVTVSRAHETFCNVVMEAASLGVPSIVSDRGTLPERVLYGDAGWVIPAGDASALSKAMTYCMQNPQVVALKAEVALKTRGDYSLKVQTEKIENLLLQVLSARASRGL